VPAADNREAVPRRGVCSQWTSPAPAGGTTAVALERGALADPLASTHLPVVGVGNPVAVPCLAHKGAKTADNAICVIRSCRERPVRRAF
jgi:hypothetical protein